MYTLDGHSVEPWPASRHGKDDVSSRFLLARLARRTILSTRRRAARDEGGFQFQNAMSVASARGRRRSRGANMHAPSTQLVPRNILHISRCSGEYLIHSHETTRTARAEGRRRAPVVHWPVIYSRIALSK